MNTEHTVTIDSSEKAFWHARLTDNRHSVRFVLELIEYSQELQIYMSEPHLRALHEAVGRCLERFGQLQSANAENPQAEETAVKSADLKENI